MAGRPTIITIELVNKISDVLYMGVSRDMASRYAGISYQCFHDWEKKAEVILQEKGGHRIQNPNTALEEALLVYFYKEIDKAEAEAVVKWQQIVDKASSIDWQPAMHMLRLRDKKNYVAPTAVDITSAGNEIKQVVNIYIPSNGRENGNSNSGSDNG